jgi:DNA-binding transcriptional ArsR family regulator
MTEQKVSMVALKSSRNYQFEQNHEAIKEAFLLAVSEKGKRPTISDLADRTGLSRKTISRHIKSITVTQSAHKARVLADEIILAQANKAMRGDTAAARLFFELAFDWAPPGAGRGAEAGVTNVQNNIRQVFVVFGKEIRF